MLLCLCCCCGCGIYCGYDQIVKELEKRKALAKKNRRKEKGKNRVHDLSKESKRGLNNPDDGPDEFSDGFDRSKKPR